MEAVHPDGDSAVTVRDQRGDELDALVDQVRHLHRALDHRDVIGQAKGILMERHRLSVDEAFDRLVQESQTRNVKLHDLARLLAETGTFEP